jgi:DNA-binding NarL/FixJ family response regulator
MSPSQPVDPVKKFALTAREIEVLAAIVEGYSNQEIAKRFGISKQTVKHHISSIFDKVGVSNRLELALFSVNHQLLGNRP